MRTRPLAAAILLSLVLAACSAAAGPQTGEMRTRRDTNVITREEIGATSASDAYEIVRLLRPRWLIKRGALSATQQSDIVVYVDNVHIGGPGALRSIPTLSVMRMEFLNASSATQRWGTNHVHGAILVSSM